MGCHNYTGTSYDSLAGGNIDRRYWNQGYASEAAGAILRMAFETLSLHRVWATCDTRNVGETPDQR